MREKGCTRPVVYAELVAEFGANAPSRRVMLQRLALTIVRLARCSRADAELFREAMNPRIVQTELLSDRSDFTVTTVISEGEPATLSQESIERLSLIYARYEPRLLSAFFRLVAALEASR